jgi:hypothetical protein
MWCPKEMLALRDVNFAQLWPNEALWTDMTDLKLATLAIGGAQEFRGVCWVGFYEPSCRQGTLTGWFPAGIEISLVW